MTLDLPLPADPHRTVFAARVCAPGGLLLRRRVTRSPMAVSRWIFSFHSDEFEYVEDVAPSVSSPFEKSGSVDRAYRLISGARHRVHEGGLCGDARQRRAFGSSNKKLVGLLMRQDETFCVSWSTPMNGDRQRHAP